MNLQEMDLAMMREQQDRIQNLTDDLARLDNIAKQQAPAVLELLQQIQIINRRLNAMEQRITNLEELNAV